MTFYRAALAIFVTGNVILFGKYMSDFEIAWNATIVFLGLIFANGPILVSIQFSSKADETLKGHWLNWLNIANPLITGALGFFAYGYLIHTFSGDPSVFVYGPSLIIILSLILLAFMIQLYIFVDGR